MKKTCVFALAMILAMPAFAATKTAKADKTATAPLTEEVTLPADNASAKVADEKAVADKTAEKTVAETEPLKLETKTETNPKIKFPHGMQLGVGISATSGLDGFIGYNNKKFDSFWWKRLGVRLGYASTGPVKSFINNKVNDYMGDGIELGDYLTISDGKIKAQQMFAVIDFYPFGDTWFLGGLRMSGGYYSGSLKVTADLTANDEDGLLSHDAEFELGDTMYKYTAGDAKGLALAKWDFSGPYAGVGFDLGLFAGIKIYLDAGVVFTDTHAKLDLQIAEANLKQSTDNGNTWTDVNVPNLNANKKEALSDAQKELDKIDYYPIVKMGFMYRF